MEIRIKDNIDHQNTRLKKKDPVAIVRRNWGLIWKFLLIAAVVFFAYNYVHTRNQLNKLSNSKAAAQSATQDLVGKIGKLVQLPGGETPTTATVNDASKLKNQSFFKNAQNGDKVLIYTKAGLAVLYRPSTNKVIQYSSVNLGTNQ